MNKKGIVLWCCVLSVLLAGCGRRNPELPQQTSGTPAVQTLPVEPESSYAGETLAPTTEAPTTEAPTTEAPTTEPLPTVTPTEPEPTDTVLQPTAQETEAPTQEAPKPPEHTDPNKPQLGENELPLVPA